VQAALGAGLHLRRDVLAPVAAHLPGALNLTRCAEMQPNGLDATHAACQTRGRGQCQLHGRACQVQGRCMVAATGWQIGTLWRTSHSAVSQLGNCLTGIYMTGVDASNCNYKVYHVPQRDIQSGALTTQGIPA
jgi:hypothetical protein